MRNINQRQVQHVTRQDKLQVQNAPWRRVMQQPMQDQSAKERGSRKGITQQAIADRIQHCFNISNRHVEHKTCTLNEINIRPAH